jgi:hypothetical protein
MLGCAASHAKPENSHPGPGPRRVRANTENTRAGAGGPHPGLLESGDGARQPGQPAAHQSRHHAAIASCKVHSVRCRPPPPRAQRRRRGAGLGRTSPQYAYTLRHARPHEASGRSGDQEDLSQASAEMAPRQEQERRSRGQVQGDLRGILGAVRSGAAQALRVRAGSPSASSTAGPAAALPISTERGRPICHSSPAKFRPAS